MKPATVITASNWHASGRPGRRLAFGSHPPELTRAGERGPSQSWPRFQNTFRSPTPYMSRRGPCKYKCWAGAMQNQTDRRAQPPSPTLTRNARRRPRGGYERRRRDHSEFLAWGRKPPPAGSIGALGKYDASLKDRGTPPSSPTFADAAVYSGPALSENSQPCQNDGGTQRDA